MCGEFHFNRIKFSKRNALGKYNASPDCFVLCIKNKYLLQLLAKGISDLAQMVEDCLFGAEVFVFAPC